MAKLLIDNFKDQIDINLQDEIFGYTALLISWKEMILTLKSY